MTIKIAVEHNGKTYQGEIARVEKTSLGWEDHGIFAAVLHMAGDSWGQGLGTYFLDEWVEDLDARRGTAYGMDHIMQIMRTAGVHQWESLVGLRLIVLREENYGAIVGFSSLQGDRVMIFKEHADKFRGEVEVPA